MHTVVPLGTYLDRSTPTSHCCRRRPPPPSGLGRPPTGTQPADVDREAWRSRPGPARWWCSAVAAWDVDVRPLSDEGRYEPLYVSQKGENAMPRSRDNLERSTQWNTNCHHRSTCAAALIGLSMMAVGHGADINNAQPPPVSATPAHTTPQPGPLSRVATARPVITFVDQPTPKAHEFIVWAIDRFLDAGLQIFNLKISFPNFCEGKAALYHVGRRSIDFCFISRRTVLHEFAHAWDDTSGRVNRQAFLELRGLTIWWGGTGMESSEQGSEQLAQIIAWGLMDVDTRRCPPTTRKLRERTHKGLHHPHRRVQAPAKTAPAATHQS